MALLGVNVDHVATLRQARRTIEPDPVWAAAEAELAGASCITFHLRSDRRHINDDDARTLVKTVRGKCNLEMSMDEEIVAVALEIRPEQATLVPEGRQELTTEGGLDALAHAKRLAEVTARLKSAGISVSAFVDAMDRQIAAAAEAGCDAVELHTGAYANAFLAGPRRDPGEASAASDATRLSAATVGEALDQLRAGVTAAAGRGLIVHGGHGLTYDNVTPVAAIPGFCEFNIGHSIIARAVFTGMREAVTEMRRRIEAAGSR